MRFLATIGLVVSLCLAPMSFVSAGPFSTPEDAYYEILDSIHSTAPGRLVRVSLLAAGIISKITIEGVEYTDAWGYTFELRVIEAETNTKTGVTVLSDNTYLVLALYQGEFLGFLPLSFTINSTTLELPT